MPRPPRRAVQPRPAWASLGDLVPLLCSTPTRTPPPLSDRAVASAASRVASLRTERSSGCWRGWRRPASARSPARTLARAVRIRHAAGVWPRPARCAELSKLWQLKRILLRTAKFTPKLTPRRAGQALGQASAGCLVPAPCLDAAIPGSIPWPPLRSAPGLVPDTVASRARSTAVAA